MSAPREYWWVKWIHPSPGEPLGPFVVALIDHSGVRQMKACGRRDPIYSHEVQMLGMVEPYRAE